MLSRERLLKTQRLPSTDDGSSASEFLARGRSVPCSAMLLSKGQCFKIKWSGPDGSFAATVPTLNKHSYTTFFQRCEFKELPGF